MCGITGIFNPKEQFSTEKYYSAHYTIRHRGPDDEGFIAFDKEDNIREYKGDDTIFELKERKHIGSVFSSRLILGHRRLSILDLSKNGHQPISFQELYMVFNGEIYNYIELRDELITKGYSFNSTSDTEVLLKAYHYWGNSCFAKFNGMWALAIFNKSKNSIILCRDRFGQKPLYYSINKGTISFSSENKFIRNLDTNKIKINENYLADYLYKGISDHNSHSAFVGINEVLPGHYLEYDSNGIREVNYWNFRPGFKEKNLKKAIEEFSYLFEDALKLRMRSDVPVGCLLSGGLDSSLIVCSLHALGYLSKGTFETFTAIFDEQEFSEEKYVKEVEKRTACRSNFLKPRKENIKEFLPKLLFHSEMPFRSLSFYSKHMIYKDISEKSGVKVALIGQGADEAFGGYTADYYTAITSYIGRLNLKEVSNLIKFLVKERKVSRYQILGSITKRMKPRIFNKSYYNEESFDKVLISSLREYLKNDDRNSMAYGIEVRSPFMDYRLMEFAFDIETKHKINKKIIRDYAVDKIPLQILNRKDKMGFVSPQEMWQQNYLKDEINKIYEDLGDRDNILNMDKEQKILLDYFNTRRNWQRVWRVFCYGYWLQCLEKSQA